ncbi:hypothetical protein BV898_15058 [Hypsibius exemplaris]|uniref:Chromo domain-containing protein n=1 Tax=Hypsibius exemplaris TaxID=2072580 RepID=A0A9X6NH60_HYPEX|nr:hypothetical protein BV898_15058 [Hypsibius exemplaris]
MIGVWDQQEPGTWRDFILDLAIHCDPAVQMEFGVVSSPLVSGQFIIYDERKGGVAGVMAADGKFRRINSSELPRNRLQQMGTDYVSAFANIFGAVSAGGPKKKPGLSGPSSVRTEPTGSTSEVVPLQPVASKMPKRKPRLVRRKLFGYQDDEPYYGMGGSRKSKAESHVPVRQSQRRINTELLHNAVLDDNLGVGIDDDANQRRSWHKPRVYEKLIRQHRYDHRKLMFQVQQTTGHREWLPAEAVDGALICIYRDLLNLAPGADFEQPVEKPRRRHRKHRPLEELSIVRPASHPTEAVMGSSGSASVSSPAELDPARQLWLDVLTQDSLL